MCEKLYEIHILESVNCCPKFYVIDRRTGKHFADWHWPPEFKQLGCDYVNEHSEFIVDRGYDPKYVKCYFVDIKNILGVMNIYVELTKEGEELECSKYRTKVMYSPMAFGLHPEPTFYHPPKKE